ncbi:MAG: hypothetical protein KGL35_13015 [Bradyrhizobium sp.]|nr:hypothetical protein [Bradyrhizobium sp.]
MSATKWNSTVLEASEHHDLLNEAERGLAADLHEFETVPMQTQRADVVTGVAEFQPVTATLVDWV